MPKEEVLRRLADLIIDKDIKHTELVTATNELDNLIEVAWSVIDDYDIDALYDWTDDVVAKAEGILQLAVDVSEIDKNLKTLYNRLEEDS